MTIDASGVIQWQTAAADLGDHLISVKAADTRGGYDIYSFTLSVASTHVNHPPAIASTPKLNATLGRVYAYDLAGSDPDGDVLSWSLDKAPIGMAIDPVGGQLRWAPRSDQLGKQDVVVRLTDQYGQSVTQQFTLTARAANLPPMINSSANTAAAVNKLYTYALRATDPEGGALAYALVNTPAGNVLPPSGMTIDAATGLVRWTPATAGTYPVTIQVTDDQGAAVSQTYNLVVSATAASQPPVIAGTPLIRRW